MVLFDKGFNVQDLFLSRQVKCVLPPFVRSKRQFTRSEVYQGKRIARARIHIERVMGRLKEFRLINSCRWMDFSPFFMVRSGQVCFFDVQVLLWPSET